jgi:preprotein translocase subunit SecB
VNGRRILAAQVGAKADLVDVRLRSVSAKLEPPETEDQIPIRSTSKLSFVRLDAEHVEYRYRVSTTDTETRSFFVRAEFSLLYSIAGLADLTDEQLDAFGEVSALFSGLPYARELVQNLTARAGLPPLVLPTLRAPIDPPLDKGPAPRTPRKPATTPK